MCLAAIKAFEQRMESEAAEMRRVLSLWRAVSPGLHVQRIVDLLQKDIADHERVVTFLEAWLAEGY
jgi:hypothetical protein